MEYIHLWLHYDGRYCTVLTRNVKSKIIYQIALCSSRRPHLHLRHTVPDGLCQGGASVANAAPRPIGQSGSSRETAAVTA